LKIVQHENIFEFLVLIPYENLIISLLIYSTPSKDDDRTRLTLRYIAERKFLFYMKIMFAIWCKKQKSTSIGGKRRSIWLSFTSACANKIPPWSSAT